MKKHFPIGTVILFAAFLSIAALVVSIALTRSPKVPPELNGVLRSSATALRPFVFKDQTGKIFTLSDLEGKWTFLFFGYTYCPDVCPTTLTLLSSLTNQLSAEADTPGGLQVVFVSVDPQRDTVEALAAYLSYFRDDFIGVTGEQEKIRLFADQFGAMFFKQNQTNSDDYLMNHTGSIFLINPWMEFIASFSPPHQQETIASQFETIRGLN